MKKASEIWDTPEATGFDRVNTKDIEEIVEEVTEWKKGRLALAVHIRDILTTITQHHEAELEKAVEAERQKYRKEFPATFGDIYTNGINYWMVVGGFNGKESLRPVVLIDGKVSHFVGYYNGTVSDIKPHAIYYGNIHDLTPTKTDKQ